MKLWRGVYVFIATLLSAASAYSADAPHKVINVAVPAVSLLQAPLFVAIDAGSFKKHGMDVRYIVTGARTIQALVGGSVQFAQGVSSRTVPAAGLAGADAILIANFSDKLLFTLHAAPEISLLAGFERQNRRRFRTGRQHRFRHSAGPEPRRPGSR